MTTQGKPNLNMNFDLDLSSFVTVVKTNFQQLWEFAEKNNESIQQCKERLYLLNRGVTPRKEQMRRNASKELSLDYSDNSELKNKEDQNKMAESKILDQEEFQQKKEKRTLNPPPTLPKKEKKNDHPQKNQQNEEMLTINKNSQIFEKREENDENQEHFSPFKDVELKPKEETKNEQKQEYQNQELIENKIFEMNERIANLEMILTKQNSTVSKKFNMLQNEIESKNESFAKNLNQMKVTEKQIQILRNQLSEYKLKKQAQFMRLTGKNESGHGHNQEFGNYIVEKIQYLSKYTAQLATREQFNDQTESLGKKLEKINKKLTDFIGQQEFYGIIKALEKKIKRRSGNVPVDNDETQNLEDDIIGTQIKLNEQEKRIQHIQQKLQEGFSSLMDYHKKDEAKISQLLNSLEEVKAKVQKNAITLNDHEEFMRNMNTSYNEKFAQAESQIIQTQESIEKINNQLKFYNYTTSKSETSPTLGNAQSTQALEGNRSIELENDVAVLKKKVNKMMMKVQTVKEQILTARQDFSREQDTIKMNVEKKSDWESLRKGLGFFQDKMRQFSNVLNGLIQNIQADKNQETTAAKRGWTCLCCDKDIKNFQGKLNEAKFMSIFPTRYESPRIGGYFKQKAAEKDYKHMYIKTNRKLSQNPLNKSKDQIL